MRALEGKCPASSCGNRIYFLSPAPENKVQCMKCKQLHAEDRILDVKQVSTNSLLDFIQNLQKLKAEEIKKKTENVRVKGLSNYSCKLISPLLTKYGLDKNTQEVKLLSTMGQGTAFDCSHLGNRAFTIESENLLIPEYGRDESCEYLKDTLKEISFVNENEERLVPIYVDGDGHCLLHAVSRALIGRELFWHPLLTNLKEHFTKRQTEYKALLGDFIQDSEWSDIIKEADPNYLPAYGETHGLRNIHVFGLANVLHRPIVLIDSLEGMRSKGDYCAVFLPALVPLEKCKGGDGMLNKPIVIAWSSKGHNHFVPLVGVRGKPVPKYPGSVLPKVWGLSQDLLYQYVEFTNGSCVIGGSKTLSDTYLKRLVDAMSKHYQILNGVAPSVVAECYQYIYKPSGVVGMSAEMITEAAHALVKEERLYKCLTCSSVEQQELPCPLSSLEPGGKLYDIALKSHGTLKTGYHYKITHNGTQVLCSYDKENNKLKLVQDMSTMKCKHCSGSLRLVKRDGKIIYFNGDQVPTPASSSSQCGCGLKHYWDGKEYDNLPNIVPVSFEWNGTKKEDVVHWFQNESDTSLNSNAFELAQKVVHKHFPGEFGSERVVQKVVEQIFRETLKYREQGKSTHTNTNTNVPISSASVADAATIDKIILTGAKSKTIHKEELNTSKHEQILSKKIEHGAALKQKRSSSSTSPIKQTSPSKIVNVDTALPAQSPTPVSPLAKPGSKPGDKETKVRISTADKGSLMYNITDSTSFNDIQTFIEEKFLISRDVQIIKYGFPLKVLSPTDGDGSAPLHLKHGERLMVHVVKPSVPVMHVVKPLVPVSTPMEVDENVKERSPLSSHSLHTQNSHTSLQRDATPGFSGGRQSAASGNTFSGGNIHTVKDFGTRRTGTSSGNSSNNIHTVKDFDMPSSSSTNGARTENYAGTENSDESMLASSLFSLLEKVDLWPWACTQRSMFRSGGLFYTQANKDLNGMASEQHFSLPCFPKKLFVYKEDADEIYLCLGDQHIPVEPLSYEQEELAHKQVHQATSKKFKPSLPSNIVYPKRDEKTVTRQMGDTLPPDEKLVDEVEDGALEYTEPVDENAGDLVDEEMTKKVEEEDTSAQLDSVEPSEPALNGDEIEGK